MNLCKTCGTICPFDDEHEECDNYTPLTNDGWLRSLNTEQLAEFLWNYTHDIIFDYERIRNPILREMPLENILGDNCTKKEAWVEWLKEIHDGNMGRNP